MYVATTNDLPGFRVTRHIGLVRGVTVRSRNAISDAIGGVQSMLGGRVGAYVKLAEAGRQEAYDELVKHAQPHGANASLAVRYDATEIMPGVTEVLCYGTAVIVGSCSACTTSTTGPGRPPTMSSSSAVARSIAVRCSSKSTPRSKRCDESVCRP
jgi:uncharacterized protein YbjQ (UPF0145 family)